jgi:hypothetical protein
MVYLHRKSATLISVITVLRLRTVFGAESLSDWVDGIATNYGGAYDNMDPYSPSFGTKDVSIVYYHLIRAEWELKSSRDPEPDPYARGTAVLQGSCGYGYMDRGSYPYWSVGAFSPSNRFAQSIKSNACGTCYEIRCVDKGGPFGVSFANALKN